MVLSELLKKLFKHLIYYYYYCVLCISLGKYMSQCICVDQRIILGSQLFPFSLLNQVLSLFLLCCIVHSRRGGPWTSRQFSCLSPILPQECRDYRCVTPHQAFYQTSASAKLTAVWSKLGTGKYGARTPKVESVRWRLALRSGLESRLLCKELVSLFLFPTSLPPASCFLPASEFAWRKRSFESLVKVSNKRYFVCATVLAIWGKSLGDDD